MIGYLYIALTILFTVYGQLVIKWQVSVAGPLPAATGEKLLFLLRLCLNPWVASAFIAAFAASLCWMAAMSKFDLSFAYPFMSLSFVLVMVLSFWFFHEPLGINKIVGMTLVVLGIILGSRG